MDEEKKIELEGENGETITVCLKKGTLTEVKESK